MMKRLAVVLLLGSLLVALSLLGAPGTAATKPMGFATTTDTPTVTGEMLNPAYFAHAAYVMQGVSDRGKVFALPLEGVAELAFVPTVSGIDPADVTWGFEISHPEGIGAEIAGDTLYIWGSNATWAGYGAVTLTASTGGGTGFVTIPVTVFRSDKTLVNAEGKKDFFVPWSPQLDINRVVSVEEHIRKYGRTDTGLLDRTVQFSAWRALGRLSGAYVDGWLNQSTHTKYSRAAIWLQVDETLHELARIGCNAVLIHRDYYNPAPKASCPVEVFDHWSPGLSMTDEELVYVVDEAHLQGFFVFLVPFVAESPEGRYFTPPNLDAWFACYAELIDANARIAQEAGADSYAMAEILQPAGFAWPSYINRYAFWSSSMGSILVATRQEYQGPVAYLPGSYEVREDWGRLFGFLESVDVFGANSNFVGLTQSSSPTVNELRAAMRAKCLELFVPVYERLNKPMFVTEGFTLSYDGAIRDFDLSSGPPPGAVYDGQEQADWYSAWFDVEDEFGFLFGFGWANWGFWPSGGGAGDLTAWPRLKPAERAIAEAYGAPDPFVTIYVDGEPSDWVGVVTRVEDSATDSRIPGGPDLLSMAVTSDEAYVYVSIVLSAAPRALQTVEVDMDVDADGEAEVPIGIFAIPPNASNPTRRWMGLLYEAPMNWERHRATVDVVTSPDCCFFELRVAKYFLEIRQSLSLRATLVDRGLQMLGDVTEWLPYLI